MPFKVNKLQWAAVFGTCIQPRIMFFTEGESDINEPLTAGKAEQSLEQLRERLKDISKNNEVDKGLDRGFEPEV